MRPYGILGIQFAVALLGFASYAETSLTIYSNNFAVVRDDIPLEFKRGTNNILFDNITAHAEPDSVILRDPAGKRAFTILEQNYNSQPLSQGVLLNRFEGQIIDFITREDNKEKIVKGKIIRSGYVPHGNAAYRKYGNNYAFFNSVDSVQNQVPVIEVDGKIRFGLPGTPIFPPLTEKDKDLLKPSMYWIINSKEESSGKMRLSYITGGMSWEADYNLIMHEKGNNVDIGGWVTMDNQSGKTFDNAKIKLMAGDINKIQEKNKDESNVNYAFECKPGGVQVPSVSEKKFDEYHLYTLNNQVTLKDRENKQVEFINAQNVKSEIIFVYDGMAVDNNFRNQSMEYLRQAENFGIKSNPDIWIMRQFKNTKENGLGIPLPKGKLRFYRKDNDGNLEFLGENLVNHTPKDEMVRVFTGNSFDVKGERVRTSYKYDNARSWIDESFEIKLKNHKDTDVDVTVVEHLFRWVSWELKDNTEAYTKKDSNTIEFNIKVPANGEKTIKYLVHYAW